MSIYSNSPQEWLTLECIQGILREYNNQPDLKVEKIDVASASKAGDNYVCQILRFTVKLHGGKELAIIAKVTPDTETVRRLEEQNVFDVEGRFYAHLLPLLEAEAKDVAGVKRFSPICYHVDFERKVIFMEDLRANQYLLQERGTFMNKNQAVVVLEALATMHGSSLRLLAKDPTIKEKFNKSIWNGKRHPIMGVMVDNFVTAIDRNIQRYNISERQREKLRMIGTRLQTENFKAADFHESSYNVICHGDCWMNNMMFHFNSSNEADDVILLDYQICNYNSIGIDLNYFIFTSVASDVIAENLDFFLETYYNKLQKISTEVSLEVVKHEFYDRMFFGAALAFAFRPLILIPFDMDSVLEGEQDDRGFSHPLFIKDVETLLPLYEKSGVI